MSLRNPTKTQKQQRIWYRKGQRRCYCGVQLNWTHGHKNSATFEHLVLKSKGGGFHHWNGLIACSACNNARGDIPWKEWLEYKNPPKKAWLLNRYENAVKKYKSMGVYNAE